ncbi:hypothetical protein GCM10011608_09250 [Micromonospora sonchi]|uniref:Uncharacterized protein n=1 Tax=Micromonospora sonchi TaxID=1763543 RepID=A0A917WTG1_9ACTN|nr:hypothetical protein [Micromonospora sonchi]GGM26592.1 hypothetical protein GCM10011608_09250 [Micromonospora sonchi]
MPLSSDRPYRPIEVYGITAADYGQAFVVMLALVLLAMGLVYLVMRPDLADGCQADVDGPEADSVESAETVELPRRTGPRTGTVCDPRNRSVDPDELTRVLDLRSLR